jgi:hypothetical protein
MRRVTVAIICLTGTIACSDSTGPHPDAEDTACPNAAITLCAQRDTIQVLVSAASDARLRNAAALRNANVRQNLSDRLMKLAVALDAGRIAIANGLLIDLRKEITNAHGMSSMNPGDAPDVAAIELTLTQIERRIR